MNDIRCVSTPPFLSDLAFAVPGIVENHVKEKMSSRLFSPSGRMSVSTPAR